MLTRGQLYTLSTLVLLLIAAGITFRHRKRVHASLMGAAFVIDFASVLYIELTRKAVKTVMAGSSLFTLFHASISTAAVVLYVVQIVLGMQMLRAPSIEPAARQKHRRLGLTFVLFRMTNYVTSFFVATTPP